MWSEITDFVLVGLLCSCPALRRRDGKNKKGKKWQWVKHENIIIWCTQGIKIWTFTRWIVVRGDFNLNLPGTSKPLHCAAAVSARPLLSTWLNWKFTNHPASYALPLIFSILCLPSVCIHSLGQKCYSYAALSELSPLQTVLLTVCEKERETERDRQTDRQSVCVCVCVRMCTCTRVCFDYVLIFCFARGCVLQFGEKHIKRIHCYCCYYYHL